MGPLGVPETIFIFVLALLIFGPKKLPELGRTIGKAMTEFRRASSELKATFDREMNAIEREADLKSVTQEYNGETYHYDNYYDSSSYGYDYGSESSESTSQTSTESASATQGADTKADGTAKVETASTASHESASADTPDEPSGPPDRQSQPVKS